MAGLNLGDFVLEIIGDAINEFKDTAAGRQLYEMLKPDRPQGRKKRRRIEPRPNPSRRRPPRAAPPPEPPPAAAPDFAAIVRAAVTLAHYSGSDPETLTADRRAVEKAYRRAAAKFHPDNQETGDREKFERVARAKQILIDQIDRLEKAA